MKKKILVEKRKEARMLREKGWSIRKIARYLVCSKDSVQRWLNMDDGDVEDDRRGWPKGKMRKYGKDVEERIIGIRRRLEDREAANIGAKFVRREYLKYYREEIPEWFINRTIKLDRERGDQKAVAGERANPRLGRLLEQLGKVTMSMDFWGIRKSPGKGKPVRFLSSKYMTPARAGIVTEISSYSSEEVARVLQEVLSRYKRPDIIKMDLHPAFGAVVPRPGCLGGFTFHLLNLGIKPLYVQTSLWPEENTRQEFGQLFSPVFLRQLKLRQTGDFELRLNHFWLEYTDREGDAEGVRENKSFYRDAFTDKELYNRRVDSFLARHVYFLRQPHTPGRLHILGKEIELPGIEMGTLLLCKLDIKEGRLTFSRYNEQGLSRLNTKVEFQVKNVLT